jgi:hypothetical protein
VQREVESCSVGFHLAQPAALAEDEIADRRSWLCENPAAST